MWTNESLYSDMGRLQLTPFSVSVELGPYGLAAGGHVPWSKQKQSQIGKQDRANFCEHCFNPQCPEATLKLPSS